MTSFTPYDPLDPLIHTEPDRGHPLRRPMGRADGPFSKTEKRRGKARAAGLIAGCAAVALVAGVGGGYLGSRIPAESGSSSSNGGSTVLYQSVSNKTGTGELSVADVAAKAADSVVEITTGSASYAGQLVQTGAGSGVIFYPPTDTSSPITTWWKAPRPTPYAHAAGTRIRPS